MTWMPISYASSECSTSSCAICSTAKGVTDQDRNEGRGTKCEADRPPKRRDDPAVLLDDHRTHQAESFKRDEPRNEQQLEAHADDHDDDDVGKDEPAPRQLLHDVTQRSRRLAVEIFLGHSLVEKARKGDRSKNAQ